MRFFQSEKCIIADAFESLCKLFRDLLNSFMKQSYITSTSLHLIDVDDISQLLSNEEIYLGSNIVAEINSIIARPINLTIQNK